MINPDQNERDLERSSEHKRNRFGQNQVKNEERLGSIRNEMRSPITHNLIRNTNNEEKNNEFGTTDEDGLRVRGKFGIPKKGNINKPTMIKFNHEMTNDEIRKNKMESDLLNTQLERDKVSYLN